MNIQERYWKLLFSPCKYIRQVSHQSVYDAVRYMLWRWGKAFVFRVDNGSPFGVPSRESFSVLHLCLVAHGVHLKLNPPRTPTRNAKVERNQGTTARWSEIHKCKGTVDLQKRLNEAVMDQREYYPSRVCKGKTRIQAYPELANNPIRFNPYDFDLKRVYRFLAKGEWIRTVSARGSVVLFNQVYQLTAQNKGKVVCARMDADNRKWQFFDRQGKLLLSLPAKGISETYLKIGGNTKS